MKIFLKIYGRVAALSFLFIFIAVTPVFAWYYFTASNGQRNQWVFSSSCNSNARPIAVYYDSDTPAAVIAAIMSVHTNWNQPFGMASINLLGAPDYTKTITSAQVASILGNPASISGQIWVAWDTDGTVLASLGVDPSSNILGIGLDLGASAIRPQDICAGLVLLNAMTIGTSVPYYKSTLLHEIGHTFGLAHSISGGNGSNVSVFNGNLPVMYPFLVSGGPTNLNGDDMAAVLSVYGP